MELLQVERYSPKEKKLTQIVASAEITERDGLDADFLEIVKHSMENGETLAQMRHALKIKKTQKYMSKDVPWKHNPSLATTDKYCKITSLLFMAPKLIVFALPLLVLAFPVTAAARLYGIFLKTPTERIVRHCGFITFTIFLVPFALPFTLMTIIAFFVDCVFYYIFAVPYYLYRLCSENGTSLKGSLDFIQPYRNGPSVILNVVDFFVALIGQTLREGMIQSTIGLAFMVILVPWMKYYINTNPWLYNLEERFIQQITTSMKDMAVPKVAGAIRDIISQAKQGDEIENDEEHWSFVPHYPYPPSGRNWCLGMQEGGHKNLVFYLIVHVTHALKMKKMERRDPNFLVLSSCVEVPLYRVMLWYNNPYHLFTGYVEASVSTGGKYQPDKIYGGEHPMWLLTSRSPFLTDRDSKVGVGWIDKFFDWWLPYIVLEIRKLLRGEEYAKKHFERVISKDGISRPAGVTPLP
jgi:hypothetical protein